YAAGLLGLEPHAFHLGLDLCVSLLTDAGELRRDARIRLRLHTRDLCGERLGCLLLGLLGGLARRLQRALFHGLGFGLHARDLFLARGVGFGLHAGDRLPAGRSGLGLQARQLFLTCRFGFGLHSGDLFLLCLTSGFGFGLGPIELLRQRDLGVRFHARQLVVQFRVGLGPHAYELGVQRVARFG